MSPGRETWTTTITTDLTGRRDDLRGIQAFEAFEAFKEPRHFASWAQIYASVYDGDDDDGLNYFYNFSPLFFFFIFIPFSFSFLKRLYMAFLLGLQRIFFHFYALTKYMG